MGICMLLIALVKTEMLSRREVQDRHEIKGQRNSTILISIDPKFTRGLWFPFR